jgi:hypothetical protein
MVDLSIKECRELMSELKVNRNHSKLMRKLFPNQKSTGVDLGNIEIKECRTISNMYTMKDIDFIPSVTWYLFFNHQLECFYLLHKSSFSSCRKNKKRGVRQNFVTQHASFNFKLTQLDGLFHVLYNLIEDKTLLEGVD